MLATEPSSSRIEIQEVAILDGHFAHMLGTKRNHLALIRPLVVVDVGETHTELWPMVDIAVACPLLLRISLTRWEPPDGWAYLQTHVVRRDTPRCTPGTVTE